MIRDQDPLNDGLTPRYWAAIGHYQWMQPAKYHTSFATERSAIRRSVIENMNLFDEQCCIQQVYGKVVKNVPPSGRDELGTGFGQNMTLAQS